jgi:hemerythrin-like domain-containing protein
MYTLERLLRGTAEPTSTVDRPIEHLVACHDRIEERLATLERAAEHLQISPEEARKALEAVFRYFESSGVAHTEDEESSVFPRLEPKLTPEEREYCEALERQHREAETLYAGVKNVPPTGSGFEEYRALVDRFCALYREHIASENNRLVEIARRLLSEADTREISAEMRLRRGWLTKLPEDTTA